MFQRKAKRRPGPPGHRGLAGTKAKRPRRVHHSRNTLAAHLWRGLTQTLIMAFILTVTFMVFTYLELNGKSVIFTEPAPSPKPEPSVLPMQALQEELMEKYDCTYGDLPGGAIPAHTIILNDAGVPVLASFDEGLAFLGGKESERLVALCAK